MKRILQTIQNQKAINDSKVLMNAHAPDELDWNCPCRRAAQNETRRLL